MPIVTNQKSRFTRRAVAAGNGLLTNLVAYWKLDEEAGNTYDAHSNGLTLTQVNNPGSVVGKVYGAVRTFASLSSQYFSRASEAAFQTGDVDFAFAAWFYSTAWTNVSGRSNVILSKWQSTTGGREYNIQYVQSFAKILFSVRNTGDTASTDLQIDTPSINAWHLLIAWHDAAADRIYCQIDNSTIFDAAHSGGVRSGTSEFRVANSLNASSLFDGRIGPVMFWKNRTLDATARAALYNSGNGLAYASFTS